MTVMTRAPFRSGGLGTRLWVGCLCAACSGGSGAGSTGGGGSSTGGTRSTGGSGGSAPGAGGATSTGGASGGGGRAGAAGATGGVIGGGAGGGAAGAGNGGHGATGVGGGGGAPRNVVIVPSNAWDQHPGDAASDPPSGTNLMYTAHIYASNWSSAFQSQVALAVTKAPVFITEWGYVDSDASTFEPSPQGTADGDGASWTAWVTDNAWTASVFTDANLTMLTSFGARVKTWLDSKADSDWVQ